MMATSDETEDDDEFKIQETRGESPPPQSFFSTMNSYAREFIFVLAVAFTAIAALQNGPIKTRKTHPPVPFFYEPSLVTDFHEGDINSLTRLLLEKDVCLVMYYAPWDSESMDARIEFEKVAKFYHNEVFFAAINCWWPDGDCSQMYKIPAYPIILVYVHDVGSIRYTGPLVANYIIAFLDNVLSPIVTLQHAGELLDLQAKHEGVLVGSFDFRAGVTPKGYTILYSASLFALSVDPNRHIGFAIITNPKVRLKFQLKSSLQLYLWNTTEVYTAKSFSSNQILDWAYEKLDQPSGWVTPKSGTKSTTLSDILQKAATIIMFTPRSLLLQSTPYYDLFREVALDYQNCNSSSQVTSLIHRVVLQRHILQESVTKLLGKCQLSSANAAHDVTYTKRNICDLTCCQSLNIKLRLSKSKQCHCRACIHHIVQSMESMKLAECENTLQLILKGLEITKFPFSFYDSCDMVEASYPIKFGSYHRLSLKCEDELTKIFSVTKASSVTYSEVKDDHIATMAKNMEKSECNRLKFGLNYSDINFPEFPVSGTTNWQMNFTGLGCRTNRSLLFVAMDSVLFHPFAESLGVDIFNEYHQSATVIIDAKQESSYLLPGNINKRSLVEFIKNYTGGTLSRFLRSTVHKLEGCSSKKGDFCLKELTTATFTDYVMDNESDVVLMYYAPGCGPCLSVYHVFLGVANYFSNIKKVKFARISGDDHDLPWEYTVEKYPTIIFFPAQRKEDSVEFPSRLPITSTNLLHFVLVNSQPKVRWVIAMRLCNRVCVAHNIAKSSTELRRLFRDLHIAVNELHFYRLAEKNKPKSKFKKFIKIQTQKKEPFSFPKYLIRRIQRKRHKILQAYQLLDLLRRKREMYLNDVNFTASDSLYPEADAKVAFTDPSTETTSSKFTKKKSRKDEL